jgi:16S rRNA (adenine1518-N6/adenine1519-N6)-dimethyltransferase
MGHVRPKKSLGQHFLTDQNIAQKIAGSLQLDGINTVIEIGPGTGMLTRYLLERDNLNLWCVEVDRESIESLNQQYPEHKDRFLHQDFLTADLDHFPPGDMALIGNLPYNISSQIFFRLLEERDRVKEMVCMIQKEVAERVSAPPGSKTYGILSVLLQSFYKIEYLFTVNEHVFFPPPKVKSGVIRLSRIEGRQLPCNEVMLKKVVKACFNQRRKIIGNSLKSILLNLKLESPMMSLRPEQLSPEQFWELTNLVESAVGR